jgi:CRP/FNR family cyclic AMP-dependent transcriptional regulator
MEKRREKTICQIAYNDRKGMGSLAILFPAGAGKFLRDSTRIGAAVVESNLGNSSIPLFSGLSDKQVDWLRSRLYASTFPASQDMMVTGMPGDRVYIILSGTVKVYIPQTDGEEVVVTILGPGDPVGELSTLDHTGRSASVITIEKSQVLWMSQANFNEALLTMPILAQNLIRILSGRLRSSTNQIQALAALDVCGRVVRQVLIFADRYGITGTEGQTVIPIRLTQNDLAGLVGASRKRVNQAIVEIKRDGWISIDAEYHITILDRASLERCLAG